MATVRLGAFAGVALGSWLSSAPAEAAVTHTTANLNVRVGPSVHYKIKAVIPSGGGDRHS